MEETKRLPRRPHSKELKARVLAECAQPAASVAAIALSHGLNANLVHKWRRAANAARVQSAALAQRAQSVGVGAGAGADTFIALTLPAPQPTAATPPDIRIELRRGAANASIHWPAQAAGDCAAWLREWLR